MSIVTRHSSGFLIENKEDFQTIKKLLSREEKKDFKITCLGFYSDVLVDQSFLDSEKEEIDEDKDDPIPLYYKYSDNKEKIIDLFEQNFDYFKQYIIFLLEKEDSIEEIGCFYTNCCDRGVDSLVKKVDIFLNIKNKDNITEIYRDKFPIKTMYIMYNRRYIDEIL